jgi:hypothetical protein
MFCHQSHEHDLKHKKEPDRNYVDYQHPITICQVIHVLYLVNGFVRRCVD